jgi:hypothetical protein
MPLGGKNTGLLQNQPGFATGSKLTLNLLQKTGGSVMTFCNFYGKNRFPLFLSVYSQLA